MSNLTNEGSVNLIPQEVETFFSIMNHNILVNNIAMFDIMLMREMCILYNVRISPVMTRFLLKWDFVIWKCAGKTLRPGMSNILNGRRRLIMFSYNNVF